MSLLAETEASARRNRRRREDGPIGDDRGKARLMHTFAGETANAMELRFDFFGAYDGPLRSCSHYAIAEAKFQPGDKDTHQSKCEAAMAYSGR